MESGNSNPPSIPPPVNSVPPFLSKTYDMVDDQSTNEIVSWSTGNNSFVVWNVSDFSKILLPKHFKHNNFSSFVRQLNTYGFRKVDPDRWEFANEGFLRGQKHLLKSINRRKPTNVQQVQNQNSCVEVGKFGIEEEVERLKRDKNVLMQELVRLRQQQQATENQLQNVGQKVQVMEQRQQQMMSFLAKAVQSPGFLNQLVQQNNDNRQIPGSNKKRRLPGDEVVAVGDDDMNRQIVKYQPSINEAAQTMLRQFLDTTSSVSVPNNTGGFLLGDVLSDNSSNRVSGVTLDEVSPKGDLLQPSLVPSPTQGGGVVADGTTSWSPESDLIGCEAGNEECFDPIMAILDGSLEIEVDGVSPPQGDGEMNELLDGVSKLPGVQDPFWEQFFADDSLIGCGEEFLSGSVESNNDLVMGLEPNEWSKDQQQMSYLTEQMGLLSSEIERK